MSTHHAATLSDSHLESSVHQALASRESEPDATAVFARATTAFMRELLGLREASSAARRDRRLLAQEDKTLFAERLIKALGADPLVSRTVRLRGERALRRLLEASGGAFSASEVAELLGSTPDADLGGPPIGVLHRGARPPEASSGARRGGSASSSPPGRGIRS
jgi:hypothetical protein